MRVDINKARDDDLTLCVDFLERAVGNNTDKGDDAVLDADIAAKG